MSEEKVLTEEIAEQFLKDPEGMDLGKFDSWEEDVIIYLLESTYDIGDASKKNAIKEGVVQLTKARLVPEVALVYGAFEDDAGRFDFRGFTELSDLAAEVLSKEIVETEWELSLALNDLTALNEISAEFISELKINGWLELNGLSEISDKTAKMLSQTSASISLKGLKELSPSSAQSLSHSRASEISLGISEISPELARSLCHYHGSLNLDKVQALSDEVAGILHKVSVYYKGSTP